MDNSLKSTVQAPHAYKRAQPSTRSEPSRIVRCCSAFRALSLPTRMSSGFGYRDGKSAARPAAVLSTVHYWVYTYIYISFA